MYTLIITNTKISNRINLINDGSSFDCEQYIIENYIVPDMLKLHYIYHQFSIGCPKSINQGLKFVTENTYVIFADSDIIFAPDWQCIVINSLQDLTIGAVSGLFLYPQSGGISVAVLLSEFFCKTHLFE